VKHAERPIVCIFLLKFGKRTRCETGVIVYFTKKDEFSVFFAFFNDFSSFLSIFTIKMVREGDKLSASKQIPSEKFIPRW